MNNQLYQTSQDAPIQPDLINRAGYKELFWDWNPACKKNTSVICQFRSNDIDDNSVTLIPDGCRCFIFECGDNPKGFVHGLRQKKVIVNLKPNTDYFIFKPYTTQGMRRAQVAWHELLDNYADFDELYPNTDILARLTETGNFKTRVRLWMDFARKQLIDDRYYSDLVEYSELMICQAKGAVKIDKLCEALGYTSRHCRERFKDAHGISIKNYSEIIRFQNSVRLLSDSACDGAIDVAYSNNYYDQSHFIKEFKKFTDKTPHSFKKQFYAD